jgi:threonine dehydratase
VLVAVGGGGLIGGIAAYYAGSTKVIGVEPETAPTLKTALAAGAPVDVEVAGLAADSLGARRLGATVFPIARAHVAEALLVDDAEIRAAQEALWDVLRVVVEPGGAAAFAALLAGRYRPRPDERTAVLLCGANTTAVDFG